MPAHVHLHEQQGRIEHQALAYAAQAHYWQAQDTLAAAEDTGTGYGIAIARLAAVEETSAAANKVASRYNLGGAFTAGEFCLFTVRFA